MSIRARKKMRKAPEPYVNRFPEAEREEPEKHNDFLNICLLMFLYIMQGIPLGLASSVPLIIQSSSKTASFSNQGTFSLANWPFSLKLLWAPIVDSIYSTRFGRRKCWLIPAQYAIGINLLVLAGNVDEWLGRAPGNAWGPLGVTHPVDIVQLTMAFFGLTMLAATQDIAVDGWALTMLSKKNLGWASTCNTVGQNFGDVVTYTLLLSLESPEICNTYLRSTPVEGQGLISYSGFLYFWGVIFLVTTTLVAVFKHEVNSTVTQPVDACLERVKVKLATSDAACCSGSGVGTGGSSKASVRSSIRLRQMKGRWQRAVLLDPSVEELDGVAAEADELEQDQEESVRLLVDDEVAGEVSARLAAAPVVTTDTMLDNVLEVKLVDPIADDNAGEGALGSRRFQSALTLSSNDDLSLIDTYKVMLGVLQLKPILLYIFMLFAAEISFSAVDAISVLKLIEAGVTKERLAFLQVLLYPFHAVLPLLITRWTNGPRPLNFFSLAMLPRLLISCSFIPLIHFAPTFQVIVNTSGTIANLSQQLNASSGQQVPSLVDSTTNYSWSFYVLLVVVFTVHSVFTMSMFVSIMAFHARISDPSVGGTYMTLLNTAANMAGILPSTLMYYLVEPLTLRSCDHPDLVRAGQMVWRDSNSPVDAAALPPPPPRQKLLEIGQQWLDEKATCRPPLGSKACEAVGGACRTLVDGFYVEVVVCLLLGLIILPTIVRPIVRRLDSLPTSAYAFHLPQTPKCSGRWWPFSSRGRLDGRPRKSSDNE